eukprot:6203668-Pleurochrysis_carterae.AAC.1
MVADFRTGKCANSAVWQPEFRLGQEVARPQIRPCCTRGRQTKLPAPTPSCRTRRARRGAAGCPASVLRAAVSTPYKC